MDIENISRRLRAAWGNALVWGVAWTALGFVTFNVLRVAGFLPQSLHWADGILIGARLGFVGAIAGVAFSSVIGLLYRGKRLSKISWMRFGIGGGLVAGVFVPVFFQTMNLLSGEDW